MKKLENQIRSCTRCDLYKSRKHALLGEGASNAPIFIIGEAPGGVEDNTGRPFMGKSGKLLDKMLNYCGFNRQEHVFLSNIIRCRPPQNRVPTTKEINGCIQYLYRQIELVNPQMIVTLGATAIKQLMNDKNIKITKMHGTWLDFRGRLLMPVYHPSALLRNSNLEKETLADFEQLVKKYRQLVDSNHYSAYC